MSLESKGERDMREGLEFDLNGGGQRPSGEAVYDIEYDIRGPDMAPHARRVEEGQGAALDWTGRAPRLSAASRAGSALARSAGAEPAVPDGWPEGAAMHGEGEPNGGAAPELAWPQQPNRAAAALGALADPTRLEVFRLLSANSPGVSTPTEIAQALALTPRSVVRNLGILRRAQLVEERRQSKGRVYRANTEVALVCLTFMHKLAGLLRAA